MGAGWLVVEEQRCRSEPLLVPLTCRQIQPGPLVFLGSRFDHLLHTHGFHSFQPFRSHFRWPLRSFLHHPHGCSHPSPCTAPLKG
jgi:hypothetical protein